MTASLTFTAWGRPIGQGALARNPHGFGSYETTKGHKPWRRECVRAIKDAIADLGGWQILEGAVAVHATCYGPRPRGHYGTGRNADVLKPSAPDFPTMRGGSVNLHDVDHLARSLLDALKVGEVIRDDSQVVDLVIAKRFAVQPTGARAVVTVYAVAPSVIDVPIQGGLL